MIIRIIIVNNKHKQANNKYIISLIISLVSLSYVLTRISIPVAVSAGSRR